VKMEMETDNRPSVLARSTASLNRLPQDPLDTPPEVELEVE
jgi:hypothetical protein